jgi:ribosomal protein S12 methylthiotransferase accessory factor
VLSASLSVSAEVQTPAGHARPFADTERWLEPVLERVPITRIYDATSLDRLGLPVWAAVTPLALDLTVHAGKGETAQAARISAVMEAVERVSAETVDPARVTRATFAQLRAHAGPHVLDPEAFDLPFQTTYRPDAPCDWIAGTDLLTGGEVLVALDLVLSPAREGVCVGVETNGLAAGNVRVEAVLHGLLEVIERDAAARRCFLRRHGPVPPERLIAIDSVPAAAAAWVRALRDAGLDLVVEELTGECNTPVYAVSASDPHFPGRERERVAFEGLGADLDPERALIRALSEVAQAHTAVLVGARDSFEGDRPVAISRDRLIDWLTGPASVCSFASAAQPPPSDLADRVGVVLDRVRGAGFTHCVAVDLTRPELGVPVVRVLVPGASGPYGETARRPSRRLLAALMT